MPQEIDLEEMEEEEEVPEEEEELEEEAEDEEPAPEPEPKRGKERDKSKRYELYEVDGDSFKRLKSNCPRCGPGIFMADHGNRLACGKCGYTEFKGSEKSSEQVEQSD